MQMRSVGRREYGSSSDSRSTTAAAAIAASASNSYRMKLVPFHSHLLYILAALYSRMTSPVGMDQAANFPASILRFGAQ